MADRRYTPFLGGHKIVGGIDGYLVNILDPGARHGVNDRDAFHFIPEELDAHCVVRTAEIDVNRVTAHAESAALELDLCTGIQCVDKLVQQPCEAALLTLFHHYRLLMEIVGIAYAVQAGYA